MKPLLHFADRNPIATGAVGALSGLGSYLLSCLHAAAGVAADVGMLLGCTSSALIVALLAHRWQHRNDWHRPIYRYRPPIDPDDDIPGL